jgi:hypothetical protein
MIKKTVLIISNLFNFDKPGFSQLRYADVVIDHKAFFLISWRIENGYKLKIKGLNYRSYHAGGSAYIAIPDETDHVELVIYNFWKSYRKKIILIRETINSQIDFFPKKQFEELSSRSMYVPSIAPVLPTPQLKGPVSRIKTPSFMITIKNLNKT